MRRRALQWSNRQVKPPYGAVEIGRSHPIAQGLVACFLFNEAAGDVRDLVNPGRVGTRNGATWETTARGVGLAFDASDNEVLVPTAGMPTTTGSVFAWTHQNGGTINGVLSDFDDIRNAGFILLSNAWEVYCDGRYQDFILPSITPNLPFSVAYAWEKASDTLSAWFNGLPLTTSGGRQGSWGSTALGTYLHIGDRISGADNHWNGHISVMYFWNRVLTQAEVTRLHCDPYCFLRSVVRRTFNVIAVGAQVFNEAVAFLAGATAAAIAAGTQTFADTVTLIARGLATLAGSVAFPQGPFTAFAMGLLEPLAAGTHRIYHEILAFIAGATATTATTGPQTYAGTVALTAGAKTAMSVPSGGTECSIAGLVSIWNDDFADGDALSVHYADVVTAESNATCGVGGGWGMRTTGTAGEQYDGYVDYDAGDQAGSKLAAEITTDLAAHAHSDWGTPLLEILDLTTSPVILYAASGLNGDELWLGYYDPMLPDPTWHTTAIYPGIMTPHTFQTVRLTAQYSTWAGGVCQADGWIDVCVDGLRVIHLTGLTFCTPYGDQEKDGSDYWKYVRFGPCGNADDVHVWAN